MRLNGLGAPDEVTLVPLNKIENQSKPEAKPAEKNTQNTKNGYCFYCNKFGHFKAECRKMRRNKLLQTRKYNGPNKSAGTTLKCDTCDKPHNRKIVGMEPMLPTIRDLVVTTNKNERGITPSNQRQLKLSTKQNTNYAAPALRGNSRRKGVLNQTPSTKHHSDSTTQCNVRPTEDWLRIQAYATIKRHNAKNEQQK